MAVMELKFTIAATSDIRATSSSWVSFCFFISNSMASRTRQIVPIWPSHTPPKWNAWGGFNCQAHPLLDRYLYTTEWFIELGLRLTLCLCSYEVFTSVTPYSRGWFWEEPSQGTYDGASVHRFSCSMWITSLTKRAKTNAQRLLSATPPLIFLDCITHGPNTSKPTLVKGGPISALSGAGLSLLQYRTT